MPQHYTLPRADDRCTLCLHRVLAVRARVVVHMDTPHCALDPLEKFEAHCQIEAQESAARHSFVGDEVVLQQLREVLVWPSKYGKRGTQLGLRWPRGCLLHGPPGVGKTLLVQVRIMHP